MRKQTKLCCQLGDLEILNIVSFYTCQPAEPVARLKLSGYFEFFACEARFAVGDYSLLKLLGKKTQTNSLYEAQKITFRNLDMPFGVLE